MKHLALPLLFCLFAIHSPWFSAQTEVVLHVNHLINGTPLETGETHIVNGVEAKIDRLEYYLCDFVITHDGGQETPLTDVYILANIEDDGTYSLGIWEVETVEGLSFGVGVDADHNVGIDPSTYPGGHPLAPQFPSMHWGWAAGYRFLALEGFGGENLAAQFQVHALGDNNFFHQSHDLNIQAEEGSATLYLNANYENLFAELPLAQGFIEHSSSGEATTSMENMRDGVFEAGEALSIHESSLESSISVFPVPANNTLSFNAKRLESGQRWVIVNGQGQRVLGGLVQPRTEISIHGLSPGVHFLVVENANGEILARERFLKL